MKIRIASFSYRFVIFGACALTANFASAQVGGASPQAKRKVAAPLAAKGVAQRPALAKAVPAAKSAANAPGAKVVAHPLAKAAAKPAPPKSETLGWIKETAGWTRNLHAADAPQGAPFARTLALAIDNQYVAVPWSFVSDVWTARSGAKFYIDETNAPNQRVEANLIDLDIASNLALFKVDQQIFPSFTRSHLRLETPALDESLAVLVSRGWVRPAKFLRSQNEGAAVRYQIALGSGDLATARFVFDRLGRLVAIAPAPEADERSWTASAHSLFDLLRKQDGPHPASINHDDQKRRQLFYWQDRWTQGLGASKASMSLASLQCQPNMAKISDKDTASMIAGSRSLYCESPLSLPLGAGYTSGMQVWTGDVSLMPAPEPSAEQLRKLDGSFSSAVFSELESRTSMVNQLTVAQCDDSFVVNQHADKVHVRYCTSALKAEPGLNDTAISVASAQGGAKMKYVVVRLRGFARDNSRRILEAMIENVRSMP